MLLLFLTLYIIADEDRRTESVKIAEATISIIDSVSQELIKEATLLKIREEEEVIYWSETSTLLPYSLEMFEEAGVLFPEIHWIIFFKETSFCKGFQKDKYGNGTPSLCTPELVDVLGFNPNNGSGMKYPKWRQKYKKFYDMGQREGMTFALCSIGQATSDNKKKGTWILPKNQERFYTDPHAVFASPMEHCKDIRLWQEVWMRIKKRRPKTVHEYIEFLRDCGYNPYAKYYDGPTGLYKLYKLYHSGEFERKYYKYYKERVEDYKDEIMSN